MIPSTLLRTSALAFLCLAALALPALADEQPYSAEEQAIRAQLKELRPMPGGEQRTALTRELAVRIRALPATPGKTRLASVLAMFVTEADIRPEILQEVVDTISVAIQQSEMLRAAEEPPYSLLATLVRYRGMHTTVSSPKYLAAMAELERADKAAERLDFTLKDLDGTNWRLSGLKGKVVLVNFWATWCPPCTKETFMLESIHQQLKDKGLVVLGVSEDEDKGKVRQFREMRNLTYPILRDAGGKILKGQIEMLPMTLIYDREGKFVRRIIDVPTRETLLKALAEAGVQ